MNDQIFAVLLMCCVQIGFGGYSVVLAVYGKGHINPIIFSLFRDTCAFPILLTAAHVFEGVRLPKVKDIPLFLCMGFIGIFGNQVLFILGLYSAGADIASIFQPSIPVLTVVVALLTRQELLPLLCGSDKVNVNDRRTMLSGWLKVGGIMLVFAGGCVMVLTAPKKNDEKANTILLGEILLLGNCTCMAVYILIQKRYVFNNHASDSWKNTPINVTAWSYMFGALFMGVASVYCGVSDPSVFDLFPQSLAPCHSRQPNTTTTTASWCNEHAGAKFNATVKSMCICDNVDYLSFLIPLCYAAFVSSSMAYGFVSIANKYLPSTVVTSFWPLQVPAAVTLNYLVNAKTITLYQGVGGLLIAVALFMVVKANSLENVESTEGADQNLNEKLLNEESSLLSVSSSQNPHHRM